MPKILFSYIFMFLVQSITIGQTLKKIESKRIFLPNGWALTPVGESLPLGDLPLNIAVSNSGNLLAVTNNGQSDQVIQLFDAKKNIVLDSVIMRKSWLGLVISNDEKYLYASGGNDNWIIRYAIINRKLVPKDTIVLGKPWPVKISVTGIAVDDKKQILYAVTKDNNSLYVIDLKKKNAVNQIPLGGEGYTCILSHDGKMLYISCWGCNKIICFDTKTGQITGSIGVGSNPNDICITKNGLFIFVSNSNDNSVSVIDAKNNKVIETLNAALFPNSPAGSTTNSVTLSDDNKTLYVANADNNCLAVFDVSQPGQSTGKGFIPTGWYPSCVRVANNLIYVANGKGYTSYANPSGPNPITDIENASHRMVNNKNHEKIQYIGGLLRGKLSIIKIPDDNLLSVYSQAVYHNTPYSKEKENVSDGNRGNPVPFRVGNPSPIQYIFYVIKENRTYDQVLGDISKGNGDTSLVLFGEKITPNQHALANEFVLLDNFYTDGEVSADGHNWCAGAYATDYLEKTWPTNYGNRGGDYDAEGHRSIANNKDGFIWDICNKHGVSYRTYGEFADNYRPNIPVLAGHYCRNFTGWDLKVRDTTRFTQWKKDFDSLLVSGKLPTLNTLRLITDHTEGTRRGKPTPFAHVAGNDLAVGLFVEYLSHSSIWNKTAIFIVEDDAQNGPDHVDAHRSTAYIAGGFVKQGFVDHTMYSSSSVLRTIELILGLPPMSQYDAAANSMWRSFADSSGHPVFTSKPCLVDLNDKNVSLNKWSKISEKFDFSAEDKIPDQEFNEVIWAVIKGEQVVCPAPRHSAFLKVDD